MTPLWLNCGAGGNNLPPPWLNTDINREGRERLDITRPLPFADGSAQFILIEHCLEHTRPSNAWRFMKEARRILRPGGVIRVVVPSIDRVFLHADDDYLVWLKHSGFGEQTRESAVENLIVNHGHEALWSEQLLVTCFCALGMKPVVCRPGQSSHKELRGVEGHGKQIGERNNLIESIVVEATR